MSSIQSQKSKTFLNDLIEVYKRHGLSLAHEDSQGAFLVEDFSENNVKWLLAAFDDTSAKKSNDV